MSFDWDIDEELIESFEESWTSNTPPVISELVPQIISTEFLGTLFELVVIDLEFRWKSFDQDHEGAAEIPRYDLIWYLEKWPILKQAEVHQKLLLEEFTIRRKYGDHPSADSFIQRMPELSEAIIELDQKYPIKEPTHKDFRSSLIPRIENFKILREVGEGGMGSVYLAQQEEPVRRQVALKVIRTGLNSKEVIARFEAERQALAMMDHQNIARIYEAGTTQSGQPFFAMEYVQGVPLSDYCKQRKLTVSDRLKTFLDVCAAVQHAHQKGILHRDLKPSNVIIAEENAQPLVKVIAFGLAKALDKNELLTEKTMQTQAGQVLGTLKYMSPEQASIHQQDVDTRADVFALGVLLYELLTGTTPIEDQVFADHGVLSALEMIRDLEAQPPSVKLGLSNQISETVSSECSTNSSTLRQILRGDLDWIVMKALENDRERRYESVNAFADDIRRFLNDEPVLARPPSTSYRVRKFAKKNCVFVTSALGLIALLILGIATTSWQALRAMNAESLAKEKQIEAETQERRASDVLKVLMNSFSRASPSFGGRHDMLARDVLMEALKRTHSTMREDPLGQASLLNALANSFRSLGDHEEALEAGKRSMQIRIENLGLHHEATIESIIAVALIEMEIKNYSEAVRLCSIARDAHDQLEVPSENMPLPVIKHHLGLALMLNSQFEDSIPLLESSLHAFKKLYGINDYRTITGSISLASAYRHTDQLELAVSLAEESWKTAEISLGGNDIITLRAADEYCLCLRENNNPTLAISILELASTTAGRQYGVHHPSSRALALSLHAAYEEAERPEDALNFLKGFTLQHFVAQEFEDAIPLFKLLIDKQIESKENPVEVPRFWSLLGDCQFSTEQWNAAITAHQTALLGLEKLLGPEHSETVHCMEALTLEYLHAERIADAISILEKYLQVLEQSENAEYHQKVMLGFQRLNDCHLNLRDFDKADAESKRWIDWMQNNAITSHDAVFARAHASRAAALAGLKQFASAKIEAQVAVQMQNVSRFDQSRCLSILALCNSEQTGMDDADVKFAAESLIELRKITYPGVSREMDYCVELACERLVRVLEINGRADEAQQIRVSIPQIMEERRAQHEVK